VLLRIHLLYFLHHDIIGALADRVLADVNADELDLVVPWHPELPIAWWDADADKSLLLGIYKHGCCLLNMPYHGLLSDLFIRF
jgi:hypothetical protein